MRKKHLPYCRPVRAFQQRALATAEKVRGPEHYDVAMDLNYLAFLYRPQGRYAEAEPYRTLRPTDAQ